MLQLVDLFKLIEPLQPVGLTSPEPGREGRKKGRGEKSAVLLYQLFKYNKLWQLFTSSGRNIHVWLFFEWNSFIISRNENWSVLFLEKQKNYLFFTGRERSTHTNLSNHSNSQICPWITAALRVEAHVRGVDSESDSREPAEGPDHRSSCPNKPGAWGRVQKGAVFSRQGGWVLEGHFRVMAENQIHSKKTSSGISPECTGAEQGCYYCTTDLVGELSPAISSHSCFQRSWLSLKWYLGSTVWFFSISIHKKEVMIDLR